MNSLNKEGKSFIIVFSCIAYAWMWKRLCAPILEVLAFLHLAAHKMLGWLQFEGKACSQKWKPKIDLCLFASCCTWHNTEAYNSHELDLLLTFDASGICANDFMQHWIRRGTLCDSETKSFSIWFLYMHVHISILPFLPSFIFKLEAACDKHFHPSPDHCKVCNVSWKAITDNAYSKSVPAVDLDKWFWNKIFDSSYLCE